MNRVCLFILACCFSLPTWADISLEPLLNKVSMRFSAEQWVTTKTALVSVGINAAVASQGIEKIQNEVMQKLAQFSPKEWHIVSFNRQQDQSGLESIHIIAQARLDQSELSSLRDKAKAISKPGETFTIDNVEFTPSAEELKAANILLRENIYQQVKNEIDSLNKLYPDQKYYLHLVDFIQGPAPMPLANNYKMAAASAPSEMRAPLSVGNKQELNALVILASMPDPVAQKINRN